jgi:type IV pilus assembly protein PilQ
MTGLRVRRNEMRLKQVLAVLALWLILSTVAVAASQLTKVSVDGRANATTLVLHTSGAFTHTEYRPADNLLLVDLSGVSAGKLQGSVHQVDRPGVLSYRVLSYSGASGAQVTRLEVSIAPSAQVTVSDARGGLRLYITADQAAASSAPAPAAQPAAHASSRPAVVRNVSVVRGRQGMEVEIAASARLTPKVMTLREPDRVVIDLPNAIPAHRPRPILVNGAVIKAVRMARHDADTRVVVDLATARDYEVVPAGHKIVLKLLPPKAAQTAPATPAPKAPETVQPVASAKVPAAPAVSAAPAAEPAQQKAQDFVFVAPKYQPRSDSAAEAKAQAETAARVVQTATEAAKPSAALLPAPSGALSQPAANLALEQMQQAQAAPATAQRARYTGEPISVNLKDVDLKDFFRLIHEISGLNIVLDPNVRGTLTMVLDDVPWDQALDIVLQNNGLDRRLEGNVLRIATREAFTKEAEARRAQAEAQALAVDKVQVTHFLSYAHAEEVLPIVKKFLSARGDVVADKRTNALLITDIPSTLPEVQRILQTLDRKTQEVEIEARVVAATRNFARDIGTQLGFGWGNTPSAVGGASGVGTSPLQVGVAGPKYFVTGSAIPLFSNMPAVGPTSGLSFTNATPDYRIDAILTMAESRGLLKILSRPRVVTQNNVQALVKQGVRIPVVTAAQLGGPPTTTYVEAALRLTVTPQITVENTIFMNVDVENTTPDFSRTVSGNPTLITQQATTQVLVTDGGTVVIGGVIQTQNSVNIFQVPLLGNIPILGNLFKRRTVSTSTQELIFFITPKIVQT